MLLSVAIVSQGSLAAPTDFHSFGDDRASDAQAGGSLHHTLASRADAGVGSPAELHLDSVFGLDQVLSPMVSGNQLIRDGGRSFDNGKSKRFFSNNIAVQSPVSGWVLLPLLAGILAFVHRSSRKMI